MQIRRSTIAGLIAAAVLLPVVAACQTPAAGPGAAGATTAASSSPAKQALLDSTKEISKGNFRFAMSSEGLTSSGVVHMPSRSARLTTRFGQSNSADALSFDLIYVEPEGWVKLDLAGLSGLSGVKGLTTDRYLHLDQNKIKDLKYLRFDFQQVDPAGSELLTKAVVDVKESGAGVYTGTIDLSKAPQAGLITGNAAALGVAATALPFEAKLDQQGRLSELTIQLPEVSAGASPTSGSAAPAGAGKVGELKVTYSDYGTATAPQKPAASDVEEAPADLYALFNR